MVYKIVFTKVADKDYEKIKRISSLNENVKKIVGKIKIDPYFKAKGFKKLVGLENTYSRKINDQHRFIYEVIPEHSTIKVLRMWKHTTDN